MARETGTTALPRDLVLRLRRAIPEPYCELEHASPWQLLVATILSAQSTDKTINRVTPILFARWPGPSELARADLAELEAVVKPTGFFRNKAKAIRSTAEAIVSRFGGQVPRTLDELTTLPGVARKTANVVLGTAFGIASGIAVDTHVGRVARRLGLTEATDPEKVEAALCAAIPRESWVADGHRLLLHGRYVCLAKAPRCDACPLHEHCPAREGTPQGSWDERAERERRTVDARGVVSLDE
ncbi:MAG: endonuclease III [Deltaproteobacteria bacterium]|nr:endonuclease III [Deltaproteobacteria bacterium]